MDLNTVRDVRRPRSRADLAGIGARTALLAGGTWLFSEPQTGLETLVDLRSLGWEPLTVTADGLSIAATCTLGELAAGRPEPIVAQCCGALYGSFKVAHEATVGGNVCLALPAGPMTALAAGLDGVAVVWTVDGGERRVPVAAFVTGDRRTVLAPGEVLRSIEVPAAALAARTAYRKVALTPLGRSATLVVGRRDADGAVVLTVTAATDRPYQFRFDVMPAAAAVRDALGTIPAWFDDVHGAPDWRRHVTGRAAEEIRAELGGTQ